MILRVFQDPSPANRRCWFAGRRHQSRVGSHQQLATPVSIRGWHFNFSHVESSNPCTHTSWWSSLPTDLGPRPLLQERGFLSQMSPASVTQTQRERSSKVLWSACMLCFSCRITISQTLEFGCRPVVSESDAPAAATTCSRAANVTAARNCKFSSALLNQKRCSVQDKRTDISTPTGEMTGSKSVSLWCCPHLAGLGCGTHYELYDDLI